MNLAHAGESHLDVKTSLPKTQCHFTPFFEMFGHTHSAYTHFSGKALAGYRIDVSKIIRDRQFQGADLITGQLVDQSGQGRASVPFKLSTYDCIFTDPVHLRGVLEAMQTQLDSHASQITLVYPNAERTGG